MRRLVRALWGWERHRMTWAERQFARQRGAAPADPERFRSLATPARFPRSAGYDGEWVYLNHMGPNVMWLAESLCEVLPLSPGMRVLDMGCGTAVSSIFLAREFGVRVVAADLWIAPSDNWRRVVEAGVADLVTPIKAEAHALPFARDFFDALVSFDSYHYFGTDAHYLGYYARFAAEGAPIGIVVPGFAADVDEIPADIAPHLPPWDVGGFFTFRSPAWWRRLWQQSGVVDVEAAGMVDGGRDLWLRWAEAAAAWDGTDRLGGDGPMLMTESGRHFGFTRVVARRRLAGPAPPPAGER